MSIEVLSSWSRCFPNRLKAVSAHRGAVTDHFHPHIIYSQPRFHNEWSAMFQAVPTRRGLKPWPCALGQCTGQACKEMTHRHGNPRPLPSVINAHVCPHVQHYAKAILSVTQVSWSKTCGGESFDVNKWGARVNGARLQLSNLSNLYFQRRYRVTGLSSNVDVALTLSWFIFCWV